MRTSNYLLLVILLLSYATPFSAQISTVRPDKACIGCKTGEPHASAALDVVSGNKGMLIPRVQSTTAITNPALGLLIFDSSTNAFQYYNGTTWMQIGADLESVVLGVNNLTNNTRSTAIGYRNWATMFGSIAVGNFNSVEGDNSSAFGRSNNILAPNGNAFGNENTVNGDGANVFGNNNQASGGRSMTVGAENRVTSLDGSAFGLANIINGNQSAAFGNENQIENKYGQAIGQFNLVAGDSTIAIGHRNQARGLLSASIGLNNEIVSPLAVRNATVGVGNSTTSAIDDASAFGVRNRVGDDEGNAFGFENAALGFRSSAFGYFNKTSGSNSNATGYTNEALGLFSNAIGSENKARMDYSSAIGYSNDVKALEGNAFGSGNAINGGGGSAFGRNNAVSDHGNAFGFTNTTSGFDSNAFGNYNDVTADYTNAFGFDLTADVYGLTVIGSRNENPIGNPNSWVSTDPVFMVGNGEPFVFGTPSTALTILKNGNTGIGLTNPSYRLQLDINSAAKPLSSTWTIASDKRLKTSIRQFEDGLDVLEKIRPIYFKYNDKSGLPINEEGIGVIAQEIQEIAPYMVKPYTVIQKDGSEETYLSYDANALFYILVNAVQEQQEEIEERDQKIETLNHRNEALETRLAKLEAIVFQQQEIGSDNITVTLTPAQLYQNAPNPFDGSTVISYFLPEQIKTASLQITDQHGKILKNIPITTREAGEVTLQTNDLRAGTYFYTLIVEGKMVETRQMNIAK